MDTVRAVEVAEDPLAELWTHRRHEATARLRRVEVDDDADPQAVVLDALATYGRNLAARWRGDGPQLLAREFDLRAAFTGDLRSLWGPALDLYALFVQGAEQAGDDYARSLPPGPRSLLVEVLLTLHAASCAIAHEVHWLLSGGYPFGAEGRSRTLHETAVVARVLAIHGADDETLVQRYVDHHVVDQWLYWSYIKEHHKILATDPPDPEFMSKLSSRYNALCREHGKGFSNYNGWSASINPSCRFDKLEELAGYQDRRPFYKLSSAGPVHPGASTLRQHVVHREGGLERLSNATMRGFGRPAVVSAVFLLETSTLLLTCGVTDSEDQWGHLLSVNALESLKNAVADAFETAEGKVDRLDTPH